MSSISLKPLIDSTFPDIVPELESILIHRVEALFSAMEARGLRVDDAVFSSRGFLSTMLFSEFASEQLVREPGLLVRLVESGDLERSYSSFTLQLRVAEQIRDDMEIGEIKSLLFEFKRYEIIRIAWRDISGAAGLDETMADLSALACACIGAGVNFLYRSMSRTKGMPTDEEGNFQQLIVLGMGKLGAGELNFSSDIDLIFVYPKEGYTSGDSPITNDEFFTRLCRAFIKLFKADAGAHFYRVDTRLRPLGTAAPW